MMAFIGVRISWDILNRKLPAWRRFAAASMADGQAPARHSSAPEIPYKPARTSPAGAGISGRCSSGAPGPAPGSGYTQPEPSSGSARWRCRSAWRERMRKDSNSVRGYTCRSTALNHFRRSQMSAFPTDCPFGSTGSADRRKPSFPMSSGSLDASTRLPFTTRKVATVSTS